MHVRSSQAASLPSLQVAAGKLDSAVQKHSHPQTAQAPSPAAPRFLSPANCHPPPSSTAGAVLAAVARTLPTAAGHGWLEGCEGGHSPAQGQGSMGREGQAMPAAAACFCGMEGCCGCSVQSGMQTAGTTPPAASITHVRPYTFPIAKGSLQRYLNLPHQCCAASRDSLELK